MRPDTEDREKLLETLRRQHAKLDAEVHELDARRWLSSAEEQEVRRLKRLKLATKDRIRQLHPEA